MYAPLAGKVVETNQTIIDDPSIVNSDAEGEGWFFRIEIDDTDAFDALMDAAAYDEYRGDARLMDALAELAALEAADGFVARHIGPSESDIAAMLHEVGAATLDDLAAKTVPPAIRTNQRARSAAADRRGGGDRRTARRWPAKNVLKKSLIGMGYHGTHTPPVIQRNVLENPGWYTAYTPYQAEIAQGRLEALLNFQTMICELTAMEIANASLLDEATAAAEAMAMAHAISRTKSDVLAVATDLHPQTRAVLATRARPIGIRLVDVAPGDLAAIGAAQPFALVLQYPGTTGAIRELLAGDQRGARSGRAGRSSAPIRWRSRC